MMRESYIDLQVLFYLPFLMIGKKMLDMLGTELIDKYRDKLSSSDCTDDDKHSALLFALQIPSVCSRIEYPADKYTDFYKADGRPIDNKLYKYWIRNHKGKFETLWFSSMGVDVLAERIYDLRNQLTHEGYIVGKTTKIYFIDDSDKSIFVDEVLIISIKSFCEIFFDIAYDVFKQNKIEISPMSSVTLESKTVDDILNDVGKTYREFWKTHTILDNELSMLYDMVFKYDVDLRADADNFFAKNPDNVYVIKDFDMKYSQVNVDNELFFEREMHVLFGENNKLCRIDCHITKSQYERMKRVRDDIADFESQHRFDIHKYL